ncbi:30S ribosomal protein S20 [Oceanirhabdus sp. W0125-5]|uniref:30S ribosomal protein S20 n=1 Tax=Oceanirhabdus sp. W0125-5 TaxID=2999116 RepID=UPI0022F2B317|nr:30S ribosomal protein S20 [Oceanirhabdus sp. W0125-5]WBW95790.1 30S ribosomal protein S20 [Oceanirhabdus sp. W0125-5]
MAHSLSAKKRVRVAAAKTLRNTMIKSALKTTLKKFHAAVEAGNKEEAAVSFKSAVKALDMAASKGILHKNNAANKKSKLAAKLNNMA